MYVCLLFFAGVALVPSIVSLNLAETIRWIIDRLSHKLFNQIDIKFLDDDDAQYTATDTDSWNGWNGCDCYILSDRHWLMENLFCLLSNAQKFTSEGEISVRCRLQDTPPSLAPSPSLFSSVPTAPTSLFKAGDSHV